MEQFRRRDFSVSVKLHPQFTSLWKQLKLSEERTYKLTLGEEDISLLIDGRVTYSWPYKYIRNFGQSDDSFALEAGRKCRAGEGWFPFVTQGCSGRDVHTKAQEKMKSLRTQATPSSPHHHPAGDKKGHVNELAKHFAHTPPLPLSKRPSPPKSPHFADPSTRPPQPLPPTAPPPVPPVPFPQTKPPSKASAPPAGDIYHSLAIKANQKTFLPDEDDGYEAVPRKR